MERKVRFSPQIEVAYPVEENRYLIKRESITDEEEIATRHSPFQRRRINLKAWLHSNYLERKAIKEKTKTEKIITTTKT